jgi:hypothetical protein
MARSLPAPIGVLTIMVAFAFFAPAVRAAGLPKGNVIVARSMPSALLIWDASAAVADLVIAQNSGDDGMRALESDAIAIMAARAPRLHAERIELRVQYAAGGIVGAAYQAGTFANQTPLLILKTKRLLALSRATQWLGDVAAQRRPAGLEVRTTGQFPHQQ